jgi:hypothetical protein
MKPSMPSARTFAPPTTGAAARSRATDWADAALRWSALLAAAAVIAAMAEPLWAPDVHAEAVPASPAPAAAPADSTQAGVAVEGSTRR